MTSIFTTTIIISNMGKVPEKEYERDNKLIDDYKSGEFSMIELIGKYKITSTRIYQILNYYNIPRKRGQNDRHSKARRLNR